MITIYLITIEMKIRFYKRESEYLGKSKIQRITAFILYRHHYIKSLFFSTQSLMYGRVRERKRDLYLYEVMAITIEDINLVY